MFAFTLVNEQGSATITAADLAGWRVRINGGAWQTLTAAGLTVAYTAGDLIISGFTGAETSVEYHIEQQQPGEPYSAVDTPATTDSTGTSIKALWARHATGPRPALGQTTANFMPGLNIVPTVNPVVAA